MLNDLLLIKKIKEGDIEAFEQMFRHYYSPLCIYSTGIVGNSETAEEIVQDLFYVYWKERDKINIFHSLKSYLYGATRNKSLHCLESQEVRNRYKEAVETSNNLEAASSDPEKDYEYKELEELINKTISQLPERRRNIFKLHRFENKKYSEIAEMLGISVKTVEAEITKTLQLFRKELENYYQ